MANWGGVERSLLDLLSGTSSASRFEHVLLTTSLLPEIADSLRRANVTYHKPKRSMRYDPSTVVRMAQWLRQQQIRLLHSYNGRANAWGNFISLLADTRVFVAGERGSVWSLKPPLTWLNRLAYQRARTVVANSQASKKMIQHRYGTPGSKIQVVPNFVPQLPRVNSVEVRQELGLSSADLVIGSVGRAVFQKNFIVLVDAAEYMLASDSRLRFVIVGGGDQLDYLKEYVESKGLDGRFVLTGYRHDARALLQAFDIFVSTSLWEPFGNVLVEAGLAGIPVVAPRIDGIPEVVVDGITGKLVEPTERVSQIVSDSYTKPEKVVIDGGISELLGINAYELASAVLELIDSPSTRKQYGEAARNRAQDLFTLERYQKNLESVYEACLTSSK